jgi:hypothetical protein
MIIPDSFKAIDTTVGGGRWAPWDARKPTTMLGMDAGADLEVEAILRGELSPACERRFRVRWRGFRFVALSKTGFSNFRYIQ